MAATTHCRGMYLGFADHLPDKELRRMLQFVTHNGERITVDDFKRLRAEAKATGYEVFPKDGCTNVLPSGRCGGHPASEVADG